jgi:hypothetical protein
MLEAADTLDEMRLEHQCMEVDTGQVRPDVTQSQGNAIRYKQVRLWKGRNAGVRLKNLGAMTTERACLKLDTKLVRPAVPCLIPLHHLAGECVLGQEVSSRRLKSQGRLKA